MVQEDTYRGLEAELLKDVLESTRDKEYTKKIYENFKTIYKVSKELEVEPSIPAQEMMKSKYGVVEKGFLDSLMHLWKDGPERIGKDDYRMLAFEIYDSWFRDFRMTYGPESDKK